MKKEFKFYVTLCAITMSAVLGCGKDNAKTSVKEPAFTVPAYNECMSRLNKCKEGSYFGVSVAKSIVERREHKKISGANNVPENVADILFDIGALSHPMEASMLDKIEAYPRASPLARAVSTAIVNHVLKREQQVAPITEGVLMVIDACKIFNQ